ncbi:MAG: ATP-binding protein [Scytolyngbya sp. HA4215-MV1]|nr:ATP-binding protein [Scytolyngbya sp. HA4215-MV1]
MSVIRKASLQVNTDLNALVQVLTWFDQFHHPPLSEQVWLQCQLILAEGFTNAVRHAHRNLPPDTIIEIESALFFQYLEIKIWDYGQPFDLAAFVNSLPPEIDQNAEGGRGLHLMRKMADELSYIRTGHDRNCLLLVKRYKMAEKSC